MIRRTLAAIVILAACARPAQAQWVVIDPANLAQAILIAERAWRHHDELQRQYRTILRMGEGLGSMERYRTPPIALTRHDAARWEYGRPWIQGLNSGDATGDAYRATTLPVLRPTVMPSAPASPRLSWTSSSGFWPLVESPTSTAPGTFATTSRAARSARVVSTRASSPFIWIWMDLMAPPKPLVNTEIWAPPMRDISSRKIRPRASWCSSRSDFGTRRTYTSAWSTDASTRCHSAGGNTFRGVSSPGRLEGALPAWSRSENWMS